MYEYMILMFACWLVGMVVYSYMQFRRQWTARVNGARAPPGFFVWFSHQFTTGKKYERFAGQKGAMNIGGIMMLSIGLVFLAIGFIFLPISTTAAQGLLDYEYSANTGITDATFTGYTSVVGITPLLILVGFLAASVVTGMMGIKIMKGSGGGKMDPGSLMLLGLSIVFIAIGLIVEPVMLDGVASVRHNSGAGISSDFTGYQSILDVAPLLVHIGFLASAVLSGFFGIKKLSSASG